MAVDAAGTERLSPLLARRAGRLYMSGAGAAADTKRHWFEPNGGRDRRSQAASRHDHPTDLDLRSPRRLLNRSSAPDAQWCR
jgi:hypothetical protein